MTPRPDILLTVADVLQKSRLPDQENENISNKLFELALPIGVYIMEYSLFGSRSEETDKITNMINKSPISITPVTITNGQNGSLADTGQVTLNHQISHTITIKFL